MNPMTVPTKWLQRAAVGVAVLAALVTPACGTAPDRSDRTPWLADLQSMDTALVRGDVSGAVRGYRDAYTAALGSRGWEGMAAVGDASMRLARLPETRAGMVSEARRAYLAALFRARHQRSIDGVLHVAEAFTALGDRDAARQALVMATAMTGGDKQTEVAERMRSLRERLERHAPATADTGEGSSVAGLAPTLSAD